MIIDKVKDTIIKNNLISKGEHIVIGLSGGPDSVCLFHILYQLRGAFDLTLHAVHINHKLRPGAAEEDEHYVEKLAKSFGVDCHLFSYDVNEIATEKRISAEDAGRQVRYGSFYQVADVVAKDTGKTVKIAIAQNMNDQAETILMRIMRGTIQAFVFPFINIALFIHFGNDSLYPLDMSWLSGSDKIIIRDFHGLPQFFNSFNNFINMLLWGNSLFHGYFLDLLPMLICSCKEHNIISCQTFKPCHCISHDSTIGMPNVKV
jgi:tRNA(Ile)-lysidine synthetase-like protein